jgi:murein DD-endopeptidase MepM/ murein hydrolase activator NlpD
MQGMGDDDLRQAVTLFNQLYGTNYDPYHPVNSGFFNDGRLQDASVAQTISGQLHGSTITVGGQGPHNRLTTEDRADVRANGPAPVQVPTASIETASSANPRSTPYLQMVLHSAQVYGVPWQLIWGVVNHETAGTWDPHIPGDGGQSHGLAQIYQPAHPDVSLAQATDPGFSIDFIAKNLATNYAKFQDWSLAVLAHNSPAAAQYIFTNGKSAPRRAPFDGSYVNGVFAGLEKLGFDFSHAKLASSQDVAALNGGGNGSVGSAVAMPDPATLRQRATDFLSQLYYRPPTPQEVEGLVGVMQSAILDSVNQGTNPFQDATDQGLMHGTGAGAGGGSGIVNPLGAAQYQVSGHYGDDRGSHIHAGIDLAVPVGTPALATVGGYVEQRQDPHGYGNYILLRGDDGRQYIYGHLSEFLVANGAHVEAGSLIAKTGGAKGAPGSGDAEGPHLHFEIRTKNGPGPQGTINPEQELTGATAMDATPAGPNVSTQVDYQQRALDAVRGSTEYQRLYKYKPAAVSEQDYANEFAGTAQQTMGQPGNGDAVRAGLETGQLATTAGYASGTPEAPASASFRQNLYKKAALLNALV